MTTIRRRRVAHCVNAFALSAACMLDPGPARATTLLSTTLSDIAAMSSAVVQAVVQSKDNLVDQNGVPWTIYNLTVERVLIGAVADAKLSIRCIGGTNGDRSFVMVGTPRLRIGDSIVAFLQQGSNNLCQASALEFGIFWKRRDSSGNERLVDFRGRVLGAIGGENIVLSADVLLPEAIPGVPETHTSNAEDEQSPPLDSLPPPALADTLLAELEAFCAAYVKRPETLRSVFDLTDIPTFAPSPAPVPDAQEDAQ